MLIRSSNVDMCRVLNGLLEILVPKDGKPPAFLSRHSEGAVLHLPCVEQSRNDEERCGYVL